MVKLYFCLALSSSSLTFLFYLLPHPLFSVALHRHKAYTTTLVVHPLKPDHRPLANVFFLFSSFFITCFSQFVPMYFENTLSNSLNNIYLIFLGILFDYFMQLQLKFNLYQLKLYNCT